MNKKILFFFILSIGTYSSLQAQRQTYIGAGLTLGSATNINNQNIFNLSGDFLDLIIYNVTFRQEINQFLSISSGILAGTYLPWFEFKDFSFQGAVMDIHTIPLEADLDIEAIRNKLDLFIMLGTQFCLESSSSLKGIVIQKKNGFILNFTVDYIYDQQIISNINSFITYHSGFGARLKLWRELHFETAIGFSSSIKPLLKYDISITDAYENTEFFSFYKPIDYWFMNFRFTYSIQDLMKGIRKLNEIL